MKNKLAIAGRLSLWALIALVTLELCARTEDTLRNHAPFFGNYTIDSVYLTDNLGRYGKPNSSYLKWHLNEVGYRGPGLRNGSYRILCMGSSETFGLYESENKEWPRQLETILNRHAGAPDFEVIDVAFPGMSVGANLKRLPGIFTTLHPGMVVIYPSYTPYIEDAKPQPWPLPETPRGPSTPAESTRFHWRILDKFHTLMKQAVPLGVQDWILTWTVRYHDRHHPSLNRLPDSSVEAFRTDLLNLTDQLQQHGVRVVLVTHATRFGQQTDPARLGSDKPVLTAWHSFFPTLSEPGLLEMEQRMNSVVRQVGEDHGLPVIDAASLVPPGPTDFVEFVHFTDLGSERLASAVAAEIEREQAAGTFFAPSARPAILQKGGHLQASSTLP